MAFRALERLRIFQIFRELFPPGAAVHKVTNLYDIILRMTENTGNQNEEPEGRSGQLLGCVFAVVIVGFIFFVLFFFMRSCGG